jgi:hypothetical protein
VTEYWVKFGEDSPLVKASHAKIRRLEEAPRVSLLVSAQLLLNACFFDNLSSGSRENSAAFGTEDL